MTSTITITVADGLTNVVSPFHPDFAPRARALGGKWMDRSWRFDTRDEQRVRELCREIYGTDGSPILAADLITVRISFDSNISVSKSAIFLGGRCVARATGRDSGARIGDGVVFLEGRPKSGGSVKNWETVIPAGCVAEIRDVPRSKLEDIESEISGDGLVEIVDAAPQIDRPALAAERDRLVARLAEIDAALAS